MNKILKMLIQENIHNNILVHKIVAAGDKYTITNKHGDEILSVLNGWATNTYCVSVDKKIILSVKWDETNSKPLTDDQKDMIDIINSCKEKIDLQETAQTMNGPELEIAHFLQKSLCDKNSNRMNNTTK